MRPFWQILSWSCLFWMVVLTVVGLWATALWLPLGLVVLTSLLMVEPVLRRRGKRRERERLIGDCHRQHAALLVGGQLDTLAYFGRYEPTAIDGSYAWCAPPQAYPETSRVPTL